MQQEIDLMRNYPRTKRNLEARGAEKTETDRALARKFGKEFFDGDRRNGYGGFHYNARFWTPVVPDLKKHFNLTADSRVLDIGCAKGFMMYDLMQFIPGITVRGIDISAYAIENAKEEVKDFVSVADARELPFEDNSFDCAISITTIHNLDYEGCVQALSEMERVSPGKGFITVDAYENEEEKRRMDAWNLTAKTVLHHDEWRELFDKAGYKGDYFWFTP
jgi:ubiquinone/menaquinone biosynthesis C-methylase UbiE